ncbi:MAG: S8 family peptidase [Candidatus Woesearchaeota archaeon]
MKLLKSNYKSKAQILEELMHHDLEEYDFYIKYSKHPRKLEKILSDFSKKLYYYNNIPYFGFKLERREAIELLRYYKYERSALGIDLKKSEAILESLDVSLEVKAFGFFNSKYKFMKSLPKIEQLWNLSLIGVYVSQNYGKGEKITIAIIDTGVDYNNPDLKENFGKEKGYNFVDENEKPLDDNGHGTHVAGIVFGKSTGIALESKIFALKVLDSNGSGNEFDVVRAIDWCIDNKINVLNMSLGSWYASNALQDICKLASQNIYLVAAAGNDGNSVYNYPASCEGVISVAAIDKDKTRAYFSNYNDKVDIAAPGVDIYSTYLDNSYEYLSGTSMATPHVTGCLALYLSVVKDKRYAEEVMKVTAEKLDSKNHNNEYGYGLIRVDKMLDFALSKGDKNAIRRIIK